MARKRTSETESSVGQGKGERKNMTTEEWEIKEDRDPVKQKKYYVRWSSRSGREQVMRARVWTV